MDSSTNFACDVGIGLPSFVRCRLVSGSRCELFASRVACSSNLSGNYAIHGVGCMLSRVSGLRLVWEMNWFGIQQWEKKGYEPQNNWSIICIIEVGLCGELLCVAVEFVDSLSLVSREEFVTASLQCEFYPRESCYSFWE